MPPLLVFHSHLVCWLQWGPLPPPRTRESTTFYPHLVSEWDLIWKKDHWQCNYIKHLEMNSFWISKVDPTSGTGVVIRDRRRKGIGGEKGI